MPFEWKRPAAFGAAFGVATAITLLIVGSIIYWVSNRSKGLDSTAIKAVSSRASQTFTVNDEKKEVTPSGFELYFVLVNMTSRDYTLPEDAKLFKRDVQSGALSELKGRLNQGFFVPAKDRAEVGIEIQYSCSDYNM